MKKNLVILIGISLIVITGLLLLPTIFKNEVVVKFTGIENISFQYTTTNSGSFNCSIETKPNVVNGSKVILLCKNKVFPFVISKKTVAVSGLYNFKVLSYDKLQIQLMEISMELKNPTFVYYLKNTNLNDFTKLGVSLYLFFVNNDKFSYYMIDNLFVSNDHYYQLHYESGSFVSIDGPLKFDFVKNANLKDLGVLFSTIKDLGYKEEIIAN